MTDYYNMSDDTPTEKQLRANPGNQYIEYNSLIWFEDGMFHLASALHLSYVGEWQKKAESSFETYEELLANIPQPARD